MEKTPIVPKEKVVKVPIDQNDQKVSHMHFTGIQPSTINMQENYLYEDIIRTQLIVHTTQNVYASLEFQFSCMHIYVDGIHTPIFNDYLSPMPSIYVITE